MFQKSLINFLLTETPSLLALLGKGWADGVAQSLSLELSSVEASTKSSVLKCFTLAPRILKSDLASQRGKEIEVHGPLAQSHIQIYSALNQDKNTLNLFGIPFLKEG